MATAAERHWLQSNWPNNMIRMIKERDDRIVLIDCYALPLIARQEKSVGKLRIQNG